jgi:Protein of unknown function (DUF3108)
MPMSSFKTRVLGGLVLAWLAAVSNASNADELRPHEITFHTTFKGFSAGDLKLTLKRDKGSGDFIYETRAFPSFLASLIVSPESLERSWFHVSESGVEPRRYLLTDGGHDPEHQTDINYDPLKRRVSGRVEGKPYDAPFEPGLQDVNSIRAALLVDLLAGRDPGEYAMLDGREVKRYVYARRGTARISTEIGELDTVIFESERKGSQGGGRTWRYWYAPSMGWLPVRIEQREDGRARLTFTVRTLRWLGDPPPPT